MRLKASSFNVAKLSGNIILVIFLQFIKAAESIVLRPSEKSTWDRLVQSANANRDILVTLLGIAIVSNNVFSNADVPIDVTDDGYELVNFYDFKKKYAQPNLFDYFDI